jgi:hypothetical protein
MADPCPRITFLLLPQIPRPQVASAYQTASQLDPLQLQARVRLATILTDSPAGLLEEAAAVRAEISDMGARHPELWRSQSSGNALFNANKWLAIDAASRGNFTAALQWVGIPPRNFRARTIVHGPDNYQFDSP